MVLDVDPQKFNVNAPSLQLPRLIRRNQLRIVNSSGIAGNVSPPEDATVTYTFNQNLRSARNVQLLGIVTPTGSTPPTAGEAALRVFPSTASISGRQLTVTAPAVTPDDVVYKMVRMNLVGRNGARYIGDVPLLGGLRYVGE